MVEQPEYVAGLLERFLDSIPFEPGR